MRFKVINKDTKEPVDADDYAAAYWEEQAKQNKKHVAGPFKVQQQLPYLFCRNCNWLIDTEGTLHIRDSCGNVVYVSNEKFEVVPDEPGNG